MWKQCKPCKQTVSHKFLLCCNTMNNSEKVKEFYSNDIVYRFDKHKHMIFGVVVDSYEASSDVDENHALQKGQIRVMWNNSSREQVWRQKKVRLMNRSIIPGDIVRRLEKGKETQRGYCKEVKQIATVQIVGTDKIIEHVCSERLQSVRPFEVDDAVCLGNKFGRIEAVEQMVCMQSECGSLVHVLTSINHELDDYWLSKRNRISFNAYYPGQELICVPANFEQPHWIKKSKTMKRNIQNRQRFTVQSVEDVLIEVSWLKVLEHPSDSCLELAERRLLKLSASDVLLKKKDWMKKLSLSCRPEATKLRHVVSCNSKVIPRVPKIRSSSFVYPIETSTVSAEDDEEWWTEEGEESDDNGSGSSRNTSMSKSRKRHYPPKPRELVPGHTLPVEKKPSNSVIKELSVYDLRKHSKFVFRPGSIVKAKPAQDEKMGKVIDSCIEGYVKVQWLDGSVENCWPTDIELIPESADYDASDDDSSEEEAGGLIICR
ncbi:unnamed protein product [Callosobruchus maculatus]|uniref:Uncharacterized protein n=1 Tax=Callosobruchus maculatus TaxID=64391 RepID=A0A653C0X4_CALMS|nr:unnamed protein product [Callosobruchus maculatus]